MINFNSHDPILLEFSFIPPVQIYVLFTNQTSIPTVVGISSIDFYEKISLARIS